MGLSDYLERLSQISVEGPRATDFAMLQSQRVKTRKKFLDQLQQAQARNVQFNAYADQDGAPNPGGYLGGNGKFNGRFANYPLKGDLRFWGWLFSNVWPPISLWEYQAWTTG